MGIGLLGIIIYLYWRAGLSKMSSARVFNKNILKVPEPDHIGSVLGDLIA